MCLCFTSERLLLCGGGHLFITEPPQQTQHSFCQSFLPFTFLSFLTGQCSLLAPSQSIFLPPHCLQHMLILEAKNRTPENIMLDLCAMTPGHTEAWLCPASPASKPLLSLGARLWSGHVPVVSMESFSYNNKGQNNLGIIPSQSLSPSRSILT